MLSVDLSTLHLIYIAIRMTGVHVRAILVFVKTVFLVFTFDSCFLHAFHHLSMFLSRRPSLLVVVHVSCALSSCQSLERK